MQATLGLQALVSGTVPPLRELILRKPSYLEAIMDNYEDDEMRQAVPHDEQGKPIVESPVDLLVVEVVRTIQSVRAAQRDVTRWG